MEQSRARLQRRRNDSTPTGLWEVPKSWIWSSFLDVAEIAQDLVSPTDVPDSPHIAPDNIESGSRRLLAFRTVRHDGVDQPEATLLSGQILFTKIRPYLLKSVRATFMGFAAQTCTRSGTHEPLDADYLLVLAILEGTSEK